MKPTVLAYLLQKSNINLKKIVKIFASNILESPLWETIVYGVCKWIKVIAEEEWKSIEEVVEDIIEEKEESDLFI